MPALGFKSSNNASHGLKSLNTNARGGQSGRHDRSRRGPYERSSSRAEEDELKLQGLEHARGKEFGTLTSAWHPEERDDDAEVHSNNSEHMIINTKTSVYYHTEEEQRPSRRF